MLSALALATVLYTVKPGDTLSGIAQHYNTTWEAVYDENQSVIQVPNLIDVGQQLRVFEGDLTKALASVHAPAPQASTSSNSEQSAPVRSYNVTPAPASAPAPAPAPAAVSAPTQSTSDSASSSASGASSAGSSALGDVPGVPQSFATCVAYRESTNDTNPAANGNAYGIIPASGYNVSGDSIAQQKQVFEKIYESTGPSAWAADGC